MVPAQQSQPSEEQTLLILSGGIDSTVLLADFVSSGMGHCPIRPEHPARTGQHFENVLFP